MEHRERNIIGTNKRKFSVATVKCMCEQYVNINTQSYERNDGKREREKERRK